MEAFKNISFSPPAPVGNVWGFKLRVCAIQKKVKIIPVPLRQKLYSTVRFGRFAHSFVYENMGETEVFCHVWQPCLIFFLP